MQCMSHANSCMPTSIAAVGSVLVPEQMRGERSLMWCSPLDERLHAARAATCNYGTRNISRVTCKSYTTARKNEII